jgi:hypothetical protein
VVALVTGACTAVSQESKDPHDVSFYPPGEAVPIDGLWVDPWGTFSVRIERGRAYQYRALGLRTKTQEIVWWSEIERAGAGRYTARLPKNDLMFGNAGDTLSISVLSETEIVVRAPIGDRTFRLEKLDDDRAYLADLAEARTGADSAANVAIGQPAVEITRLLISPGMVVAPGAPFDLELDYVITGTSTQAESMPLVFAYSVSSDGTPVFESQPIQISATVGTPQSRVVHLDASHTPGSYEINARIEHEGAVARSSITLIIGDETALLDALAGTWDTEIPGNPTTTRMRLVRDGDGLRYSFVGRDLSALPEPAPGFQYPEWNIGDSSVVVSGGELVITVDIALTGSVSCAMKVQDRLRLTGTLDELHGEATVLDGGDCVRIGEVFNVTYHRVE